MNGSLCEAVLNPGSIDMNN